MVCRVNFKTFFFLSTALALLVLSAGMSPNVFANHSWHGYHWSSDRNINSGDKLPLWVNDNTAPSVAWGSGSILISVINKWNDGVVGYASPFSLTKGIGNNLSNQRKCPPTFGRVEVCNTTYGKNGWLGIASIWISNNHITQGTVKLNDSYFNTTKYNTSAWKNLVLCQELGHTLGLDHQDEAFSNTNLNTCMDYTNNPSTNQYPNAHDFEQLGLIYNHSDSTSSAPTAINRGNNSAPGRKVPPEVFDEMNEPSQWGNLIRRSRNGLKEVYLRNLGEGHFVFTFVTRAQ